MLKWLAIVEVMKAVVLCGGGKPSMQAEDNRNGVEAQQVVRLE